MLCSEMRDGNVPAREANTRVLSWALELLPTSIEEVMIRSDSAGHSAEVLQPCNRPKLRPAATQRFGVIGFTISAVRSQELMSEVARVPEAGWTLLRVLEKRTPEGGGNPLLAESGLGDRGHRGSELSLDHRWLPQARRECALHRRPA